jgi:hypothetical protein
VYYLTSTLVKAFYKHGNSPTHDTIYDNFIRCSGALKPPANAVQKDRLRQRMDWLYQQRAFPHQRIPEGSHQRGWMEFQQKLAA